jgi:hypothetical protein
MTMHTERSPEGTLYLYGIVRQADAAAMGAIGLEVAGRPADVYPIVEGDVGVMVSAFPAKGRVLPVRKNLDAHNKVLRELTKVPGGVLPLRFGHVVPGERDVRRLLVQRRLDILRELATLDGKTEMALAVSWDVENVFAYFATQHKDLGAMRDEMFADGREPSRNERVELGHAFAGRLDDDRARYRQQVIEALDRFVVDVREDRPRAEKQVVNLALLVERSRLSELDTAIQEIAAGFPDAFLFKYTGPFAPFHFVGLEIEDDNQESEEEAAS